MKLVFISNHDYLAKRQGGFHVYAKILSKEHDVVFFSYPRSLFIKIRKNKLIEYDNIDYFKERIIQSDKVLNVSRLFLILPSKIQKFFPKFLIRYFHVSPYFLFKKFCKKYFDGVDCFIFESNASVIIYETLKKLYPKAKFVYRPSDPMLNSKSMGFYHKFEIDFVKKCDFVFPVNKEGVELYKKHIPNLNMEKVEIISNGIDISLYDKDYERPKEFGEYSNIACYVGARPAQWDLLEYAAYKLPDVNFFIICPENPTSSFIEECKKLRNLHFIQGIEPAKVPAFVKNADLIIIPNPTDMYKDFPWGVTAKYYQAMYSKKRIVSYSDNENIKSLAIPVTYNYEDFVNEVKNNIGEEPVDYDFDFSSISWDKLALKMNEILKRI